MRLNSKMLTSEELRKLSEEDFDKLIEEKYGTDWDLSEIEDDELLNNEFWYRLGQAK